MKFELEVSVRHMWLGLYWETWPKPFRRDIWITLIPFVAIHITVTKG